MNTDEIRARAEAATRGPWKAIDKGNSVPSYAVVTVSFDGEKQQMVCPNMSPKTANAEFIAHAREDIPALLDEVERLMGDCERLHDLMDEARDGETNALNRAEQAERERDAAADFIRWLDDEFSRQMPREYFEKIQALENLHFERGAGGGE